LAELFNILEGIYSSFNDAGSDAIGPGFGGDIYRTRSLNVAHECLTALNASRPIPSFHKQRSTLADKFDGKYCAYSAFKSTGLLPYQESILQYFCVFNYENIQFME
jgi:hypothetical protein